MTEKSKTGLIAIEVKTSANLSSALVQLLVYLDGIQQLRRSQKKIVSVVYGFVMDGFEFQFFRLSEDKILQSSSTLVISDPTQAPIVFSFIDAILEAAAKSSPHTTPTKTFPWSSEKWSRKVESELFNIPNAKRDLPDFLEEVTDDDDDDDDHDFFVDLATNSKYKTVILTPKKSKTAEP